MNMMASLTFLTTMLVLTVLIYDAGCIKSVQKVSSHIIGKIETFIEDTRNIVYRTMTVQSRHLGSSHSSPNLHQLPPNIFLNLIGGLKSLPFQK